MAGLWSSAYSLGEMLGPAIGGFLLQHWGFPKASTSIAALNLLFALISGIYFFSSSKNIIYDKEKSESDKEEIKGEVKIYAIT